MKIRCGTQTSVILASNRGCIIEDAIHEDFYNNLKNWDYAGLVVVLSHDKEQRLGLRGRTDDELAGAPRTALNHAGPCLIEVDIDPTEFDLALREWGARVAAVNGQAPA